MEVRENDKNSEDRDLESTSMKKLCSEMRSSETEGS